MSVRLIICILLPVVHDRPLQVRDVPLDGQERIAGSGIPDGVRYGCHGSGEPPGRVSRIESSVIVIVVAFCLERIVLVMKKMFLFVQRGSLVL